LKLNKKTNKVKISDNNNNAASSNNTRRIKSAEPVKATASTTTKVNSTTKKNNKLPVKLFTDKTFFSLSSKQPNSINKIIQPPLSRPALVKELTESNDDDDDDDDENKSPISSLSLASISITTSAPVETEPAPEPTEQKAKEKNQLDKRERIDLYNKLLTLKPPACNIMEAFDLINNSLIEIED